MLQNAAATISENADVRIISSAPRARSLVAVAVDQRSGVTKKCLFYY